jgi:hypothetical protein
MTVHFTGSTIARLRCRVQVHDLRHHDRSQPHGPGLLSTTTIVMSDSSMAPLNANDKEGRLAKLPTELYVQFCSYMDTSSCVALVATCRRLRACQSLAWEHVVLIGKQDPKIVERLNLLSNALEESRQLRSYVRTLKVFQPNIGPGNRLIKNIISERLDPAVARLLRLTTNVQTVVFAVSPDCIDSNTLTMLALAELTTLKALALDFVWWHSESMRPSTRMASQALEDLTIVHSEGVDYSAFVGRQASLRRVELQLTSSTSLDVATSWISVEQLNASLDVCRLEPADFERWSTIVTHALVSSSMLEIGLRELIASCV